MSAAHTKSMVIKQFSKNDENEWQAAFAAHEQ